MKQLKGLVLALLMLCALVACGGESEADSIATEDPVVITETEDVTEAPTEEPTEIPTEALTMAPVEVELEEGYESVQETVYATQDVNVRSGPGTDHEKVGTLAGGNSVVRVGVGSDGWSKVIFNDVPCYISSKYLTTTEPAAATPETAQDEADGYDPVNETVYATQDVNVRSGPGTDHDKVGTLSGGEAATRTGKGNNGWSQIEYNGKICYVSSKYLSTTKPSETKAENTTTTSTGQDYVANKNTKKFHEPSCSSVKDIKSKNRWDFHGTRQELINEGYQPCKRCNP